MAAASDADCTRSRRLMPSLRSSQGRSATVAGGGVEGGVGVAMGPGVGEGGAAAVNHQVAPPIATSNNNPRPANNGVCEGPSCLARAAISSRGGGADEGAGAGGAAATGAGFGAVSGSRGITVSGGRSPSNTSISSGQNRLASKPVAGSRKTSGPGSRCRVSLGQINRIVSTHSLRI